MEPNLHFRTPTCEDETTLYGLLEREYSCELTPVSLAFWAKQFHFEVAVEPVGFFYRTDYGHGWCYGLPFADDMKAAVASLCAYTRANGHPLRFYAAAGPRFDAFHSLCADDFSVREARDGFEYIYRVEDLTNLAGKAYHGKRNHVAAFNRQYPWRYESLSRDNLGAVLSMADRWYTAHEADCDKWLSAERNGMKTVLSDPERYRVKGGVLWVGDTVAAVTFGCPVNSNVFDVNFEKAFTDFNGAYTVINQQFVANELQAYRYVNREDDMGREGLRRAKLSYHPALLLKKYRIDERND